jgi:aldehyde:ferredoxin oxidoreductase
VEQPNNFYKCLARGVEEASTIYGGKEFALAFGKNEMPGYHTGPGGYLGYLIGARHSHLDSAGYSIDQKELTTAAMSPEKLIEKLLQEEWWRQILSSLVVCFFARGIYTPEVVSQLLAVSDFHLQQDDLTRIGCEVHREKYRFKVKAGFDVDNLRIPARIFETPSPVPNLDEDYMRKALCHVKKLLWGSARDA